VRDDRLYSGASSRYFGKNNTSREGVCPVRVTLLDVLQTSHPTTPSPDLPVLAEFGHLSPLPSMPPDDLCLILSETLFKTKEYVWLSNRRNPAKRLLLKRPLFSSSNGYIFGSFLSIKLLGGCNFKLWGIKFILTRSPLHPQTRVALKSSKMKTIEKRAVSGGVLIRISALTRYLVGNCLVVVDV